MEKRGIIIQSARLGGIGDHPGGVGTSVTVSVGGRAVACNVSVMVSEAVTVGVEDALGEGITVGVEEALGVGV